MDLPDSRRFGGGMGALDDKAMGDDADDRRFDSRGARGRASFGRGGAGGGRRPSPSRQRDYGFGGREDSMMRDRSPLRGMDDRFNDRFKKDDRGYPKRDEPDRKDMGRSYYGGDDAARDRYMDNRSRMDGGFHSRSFDGPQDSYKSRPMGYPTMPPAAAQYKGYFQEGFPKPNECEIIAVNKQQRAYAESVEARIKNLGILVDVLFLKDEALLTQTIDDIARRGSLYAIIISPTNETHGSVTVNILHGTAQEHRNMPLEDAMKLLGRNFHDYIRSQKESMERERAERGAYTGAVPADREIQFLLRMLADGRWVSMTEINIVIRYLSERRDKMQGSTGDDRAMGRLTLPPAEIKRDVPFKPKDDIDVAQKEQDLQNRIMNIMNQGAPSVGGSQGAGAMGLKPRSDDSPNRSMNSNLLGNKRPAEESIPVPKPLESTNAQQTSVDKLFPPSGDASAASFKLDASVQKALDSLMQSGSNLLKNISTLPNTSQAPPPVGAPKTPMGGGGVGMGPPRGPMSDMPPPGGPRRGPGGNMDMGTQGMSDLSGQGPQRGPMSDLGGSGPPRGPAGMSDNVGAGPQRGPTGSGPDMMGMGQQRGRFGGAGGMSDMGGMNRGYGGPGGMSDMGMGQRMPDMGRPPPHGMGAGGNFPGQNQFGKNQFGGPGQQGNFSGPNNMPPRGNFGGFQGMGGPNRY